MPLDDNRDALMRIRPALRTLRAALDRFACHVWLVAFKGLGRLRTPARPSRACGGQRILVVAPHPDDEVLGCGGTMAQHLAAGDYVCVAIVTDGRRSRAHGLEPEAMSRVRRAEATEAARVLGLTELCWIGLEEGAWAPASAERRLAELIDKVRPDIIYGPSTLDYQPEHRRVAAALARIVPAELTVRIYTLDVPLTGLVNLRTDVSAQMPLLEHLFRTYRTQSASLLRGLRLRRYAAALNRCGTASEEFWELDGAAYRRAHSSDVAPAVVRGVRFHALGDPLSYLVGRRERLERRAAAE